MPSFSDVPFFGHVAMNCRKQFENSQNILKFQLEENTRLRNSIDMAFLNISRPILRRIEIVFRPALTRVQWMSQDLDFYLTYINEKLIEIHDIIKRINDTKEHHIMALIKSIRSYELIDIPEEPMDIQMLLRRNTEYRKFIGLFGLSYIHFPMKLPQDSIVFRKRN